MTEHDELKLKLVNSTIWMKVITMIVIIQDVYDQILKQNILKDDHIYRHRAQNSLKTVKYNYFLFALMIGKKLKLSKI